MDGLKSFESEVENTERLKFHGKRIRVLKLERILKSKETVARDKDLAHIIHIRNFLRCRRMTARNRKKKAVSGKRGSS